MKTLFAAAAASALLLAAGAASAADVSVTVGPELQKLSRAYGAKEIETLRQDILSLFADTPEGQKSPTVTLLTAHKSKGREWHRVLWWGKSAYQPSKYARQEWQQGQERNLMYVAATRAQHTLLHVHADPEANLAA